MPYRLIVHRHSGTASYHDVASLDPRCQDRDQPGYSTIIAESWREVEVVVWREGLKLVPRAVCLSKDRPASRSDPRVQLTPAGDQPKAPQPVINLVGEKAALKTQ